MRKKKIIRWLLITLAVILGVLVFLAVTGTVAHAAGLVDNTVSDANAYSKYPLENYQLDFYVDSSWDWLPWNWLDGIGKSIQYGLYAITNFVWTVSLYISNATGYVVQEAYKLDFISDTASSIGKNIQTLAGVTQNGFSSEGFYVGFLLILILVMGIYVAYTGLVKRETTKAVHAVVNFLVVFILSASFIAYAPNYISKINGFSADISNSALSLGTKIVLPDSNSKGKDSVDLIRDSLFSIQVKQPWLLLQYGESDIETLGADRVESLLSASPDTDDREDIVIDEIEDKDNANLSVTKTMSRLGTVVFLFIFNIGISIFVFLLTGMMIFSQVLFIIYAMFLPVSFILSMIPTYEGMAKKALTKLFNTIMLRAGITLIITTAFSISTMFYSISAGYPFFMAAFLQIVTFAGIYMKLGDLMSMFSLQANDTQQVGRRIMRRPYLFLSRRARRLERKIGRTVAAGAAGGVAGAAAASATKKADTTKSAGGGQARPNNTPSSHNGGSGKPPALPDKTSQKKDTSKSEIHNSASQTQEMQSTSNRGIMGKQSVSKQPQAEKQNPQRPIVNKTQDKQEPKDKERQSNGSATKGAAPVHGRPATTSVPVKSDTKAAASKQEQNVKERPVTVTKEQPQASRTKEPVTRPQENVRTQVVRESRPAGKHSGAASENTRQTIPRKAQTKTVQKKNTTGPSVKESTNKKGGRK